MKVLVVEDDATLSGFVQRGLEAEGFVVDLCMDGNEGYVMTTTRESDAIVLDIMLPGRDGLIILRNLREEGIEIPVIVLMARGSLNECLEGLKGGGRLHDEDLLRSGLLDHRLGFHAINDAVSVSVEGIEVLSAILFAGESSVAVRVGTEEACQSFFGTEIVATW